MKKTAGFCSFIVCLWAFFLSSVFALQSGDFTYTESDGQVTITGYIGPGGAVVIPSTIDGNPVVIIGESAFYACSGLTSVTIPGSVTNIGESAFWYCTGLTSIAVDATNTAYSSQDGVLYNKNKTTLLQYPGGKPGGEFIIPGSVTSIGCYAFSFCPSLTSVTIPSSVTNIGDGAFSGCASLTSVTIPSSVTSIGCYAFSFCPSLTSVTIPSSVTSIGDYAFLYCTGLTSIAVEATNAAYSSQDGVLYNKNKTTLLQYPGGKSSEFIIPDSVTSIGNQAFSGCTGLTSVTIPGSVTSIGNKAFSDCPSLTSVTIPSSVTSIGDGAFVSCRSLISVTIPSSVTSIGGEVFNGCNGLTSITIPGSVTSIGDYAFSNCSSLTSIIIPDSVTSIGNMALSWCSGLTSITIPDSVTSIGTMAFFDCSNLNRAYFSGNAPSMGSSVFSSCADNFLVCYTAGATGFTNPWYGYPAAECDATLIALSSFTAAPGFGEVILAWSTESETDNAGFNIYRADSEDGKYIKINDALIPAEGSPTQGASYTFTDDGLQNRKTYWYKLEDIDLNGKSTMHGPVSATPRLIYGIK